MPEFPEAVIRSKSKKRNKTKSPSKKQGVRVLNLSLQQAHVVEPKTPVAASKNRAPGVRKKKTGGFDTAVGYNAAKSLLKLPPKMSGIN